MKLRGVIGVVAILMSMGGGSGAQVTGRVPGDELTVFLATMGQGVQVYELFGHNAIWIHDSTSGTTAAYNYGVFDSTKPSFLLNFIKGKMVYQMDVDDAEREIYKYTQFNRTLQLQRLNMTGAQKDSLRKFLDWNWLEEHRSYVYDYFRDNCSTRVRDALDRALGGQIRAQLVGRPTGTTFASHSYRLTAGNIPIYTGLMIAFGLSTTIPLDAWEETFVPGRLMENLKGISVPDGAGGTMPLVSDEQTLFLGTVPPTPESPPAWTVPFLLIGLIVAGVIFALSRAAPTARGARIILATLFSFWGVATALFGIVLAMLWIFTDHSDAHQNLNLLQLNPLGLLLAVAAPLALADRARLSRLAVRTALVLAVLAILCLVIMAVPGIDQENGPLVALLLPIHLSVAWSLYHLTGANMSPVRDK